MKRHRTNIEIIHLTEELAMQRYCQVRYENDDENDFGELSPKVINILKESNPGRMEYPNIIDKPEPDFDFFIVYNN